MKIALPISVLALALALFTLAAVLLLKPLDSALGGAFTGTSAQLQFATTTAVGPQDGDDTIFTSNDTCKARVVTTRGDSAITLNFGDPGTDRIGNISSTTLSATVGHLQLASTTVVYDSGLYGCGRVSAYSYASQTITISEF